MFDLERRELRRRARIVSIGPKVFDIIAFLIQNRHRVVSKDDLLDAIWAGRLVSESALTTCINAARSAIGDSGRLQRFIRTSPRKGFRFVGEVYEEQTSPAVFLAVADIASEAAATGQPDQKKLHGLHCAAAKASIGVIPFVCLYNGSNGSLNDFGSGLTVDIITQLSHFSELAVVQLSSDSTIKTGQLRRDQEVQYVFKGCIRQVARKLCITGQLIETETGVHLWAGTFDRQRRDVVVLQGEIARTIVGHVVAHISRSEVERSLAKPSSDWQAYEYYLHAATAWTAFRWTYDRAHFDKARTFLQASINRDPFYARAHALLADTYMTAWQLPIDSDYLNPLGLHQACRLANRALQLNPALPMARVQAAFASGFLRQFDPVNEELEAILSFNPNYTDWRLAQAYVMMGNFSKAVVAGLAYESADPFHEPVVNLWLGAAYYMQERYDEALPFFQKLVARTPNSRAAHIWSAANYAQLGLRDMAKREVAETVRIDPRLTVGVARRLADVCKNRRDSEHYVEGLRIAGLPKG